MSRPMTSKTWLITGCSSGFGEALARHVLASGDRAIITARKRESVEDLVRGHAGGALPLALDVTDLSSVSAGVNEAVRWAGQLDVLVNNAGYAVVGAIEELSDDEVRRQFDTNVFGMWSMIRAALPAMRAQRVGHIINISSGISGFVASPGVGAYAATKHAVEALTEALAAEVEPLGIHVTAIEPGSFRTQWAGRSMMRAKTQIDAYVQTVGRRERALEESNGRQTGDPSRAAQVIHHVAHAPNPPRRLALGSDALSVIETKLRSLHEGLEQHRHESLSTDFGER
jgi:NAD(P)-dependent dehydrogenase (short-subunit alcohol dehydrogenase family)